MRDIVVVKRCTEKPALRDQVVCVVVSRQTREQPPNSSASANPQCSSIAITMRGLCLDMCLRLCEVVVPLLCMTCLVGGSFAVSTRRPLTGMAPVGDPGEVQLEGPVREIENTDCVQKLEFPVCIGSLSGGECRDVAKAGLDEGCSRRTSAKQGKERR